MKMKPAQLIPVAIVIAFCFAATFPAGANPGYPVKSFNNRTKVILKKIKVKDPYLRLNEINSSAARDFMKRFPLVTTDKWLKIEGGYLAKFSPDKFQTKVYYDNQGRFLAITRFYKEANTPAEIKTIIQQKFPGYEITGSTEMTNADKSFYRVNIKNSQRFKVLQVTGYEIKVLEDLKNGEIICE
jgi:hypothetical protein